MSIIRELGSGHVKLTGTAADLQAALAYPMNLPTAKFLVCDHTSSAICRPTDMDTTAALACQDDLCLSKAGTSEYVDCSLGTCADVWVPSQATNCISWADPILLQHNIIVNTLGFTPYHDNATVDQIARYKELTANGDTTANAAQLSQTILGLCVVVPPVGSNCSSTDSINQTPMPIMTMKGDTRNVTFANCANGKVAGKSPVGGPCADDTSCLLGSCSGGICQALPGFASLPPSTGSGSGSGSGSTSSSDSSSSSSSGTSAAVPAGVALSVIILAARCWLLYYRVNQRKKLQKLAAQAQEQQVVYVVAPPAPPMTEVSRASLDAQEVKVPAAVDEECDVPYDFTAPHHPAVAPVEPTLALPHKNGQL